MASPEDDFNDAVVPYDIGYWVNVVEAALAAGTDPS
ncbi:MAG: amidohydrolase [Mesorhizobium sp.]|nr:MAG: amidohydrolase [Mesorhizobium sp.]